MQQLIWESLDQISDLLNNLFKRLEMLEKAQKGLKSWEEPEKAQNY